MSWLVDNFGGRFPKLIKYENENWKDTYYWKLSGKKSYMIIKKIRNHLLLKREQADCAIDLYEQVSKWHYGGTHVSRYKQDLAEELYQKCKKLNKIGKSEEEDDNELEIKITVKKKDHTWDDYELKIEEEEEGEEE